MASQTVRLFLRQNNYNGKICVHGYGNNSLHQFGANLGDKNIMIHNVQNPESVNEILDKKRSK